MMEKKVKDIELKIETTNELIKQLYDSGGFTAKKLAVGIDILEEMIKQKNCIKFLSFPACIISTGTRGIIKELIKKNYVIL